MLVLVESEPIVLLEEVFCFNHFGLDQATVRLLFTKERVQYMTMS